MSDNFNDLQHRLLDLKYRFIVSSLRQHAIGFAVVSPVLAGVSGLMGYSATTVRSDAFARQDDYQAAWQNWQQNMPANVAKANVVYGKHAVLGKVVKSCTEQLVADHQPQPYKLQADNSLAVSAPVVSPVQVQQKFRACVEQQVLPTAVTQPGYGETLTLGAMSLAAAAGAVFIGVQARKSWSYYKQSKALYNQEKAALLQPAAQPNRTV